jgi:hypothetical protein
LQSIYGDAWVLQAIEIAEDLRKAQEKWTLQIQVLCVLFLSIINSLI